MQGNIFLSHRISVKIRPRRRYFLRSQLRQRNSLPKTTKVSSLFFSMSIVTNKTAFYKKLYYHQTSCKICVISVPKLTFDIFYLLEADVFEMDNNLWIIISSERKWNLKHDERFFLFSAMMLH